MSNKIEYIKSLISPKHYIDLQSKNFMQITEIEGKILQLLIKMNKIQQIVEVGTLFGYSTMWMAEALENCGKIYTIEKDLKKVEIAKKNLAKFDNINFIVGDAQEELLKITSYGKFDMIFIDANKSGYINYLNWAEENIKNGGLIVADNTLIFGKIVVYQQEEKNKLIKKIRDFNKQISNPKKYDSVIMPTEKGLTIAIKKF